MIYIAQIITFLAALLAAIGGTWNYEKKGIIKFTRIGWVTVFIAFLSLIASTILNIEATKEANNIANDLSISKSKILILEGIIKKQTDELNNAEKLLMEITDISEQNRMQLN